MKIEISSYSKDYAKEVARLFTNSIHETCINEYTKEQLDAWANPSIDYDFWENRLDKTNPYLAFIDGVLVGFCEFYDDYIDCFYVHYQYQRKGVGRALISYILDLAKAKRIKKVKVDASITAKQFFLDFGFYEVKKNYVKRADQELINYSLEFRFKEF